MDNELVINIIVSIGSMGLTSLLALYLHRRAGEQLKKSRKPENLEFFKADKGRFNSEFYNYFEKKIEKAQNNIFVTGKGLNLSLERNNFDKNKVIRYLNAFKGALEDKKGLIVTRVQFGEVADHEWYSEFYEIWKLYPDRLNFLVVKDYSEKDMLQVAVIDPDIEETCVSEILLATKKDYGYIQTEVAGSALFVERDMNFAEMLKNRILKIIQTEKYDKIDSDGKWEELIKKYSV